MGHDSSDFMTCDKCGIYEIDLRSTPPGLESGSSKHTFCKECYPIFFKYSAEALFSNEQSARQCFYEGIPKDKCPMCVSEAKDKEKVQKERAITEYLLKKVGMTRREVFKEMTK
jgi:hypothetical protein